VRKTDELDTIDGAEPREAAAECPASRSTPRPDYAELTPVDRRHYVITGEIAKGGMGRVLDARDLRLGRAVAIKELLPKNRDLARRFEREARITARLQHPAIIHIYEAGVWIGGEPFYAMAKVSGRSLDEVIAEKKTLNDRLGLLPNIIAVAEALAYAHNAGVIHRDLKPANVLVGEFGQTVVIDWGLAKDLGAPEESGETTIGNVVGTPSYMPPEQARGESVDQRADVYAIGALLYTALVGRRPFSGTTHKEVLDRVRTEVPTAVRELEPGTPLDLAAIVEKAMDRDPEHRYADAGELAQDLRRFETGQLVAARHYTSSQLTWRWLRRHRVVLAITGIAVIALAIVGGLSLSRIVADSRDIHARRQTLMQDRGRTELLAAHLGKALIYLVGAAGTDDVAGTEVGLLMVEAMRSFEPQVVSIPTGDRGRVLVAYSPDGTHVAVAASGAVQIWDGTRIETRSDRGMTRTGAITFDPHGERFATGDDDGVVRLWSHTGSPLQLSGHTDKILDVTFSSDGTHLATASADGTTRVWEVDTGKSWLLKDDATGPRSCNTSDVVSVRFNAKGTRLATASGETACIWERESTGWSLISPLRGHTGTIRTVRWNQRGYIATASDDGTARVWLVPTAATASLEIGSGRPVIAPIGDGPPITSAEWTPDGKRLLVADADHAAGLWRIPDGEPDPKARARQDTKLAGRTTALTSAVFSSDGSLIATAGQDSWARVWDASTGQMLIGFELPGVLDALAFSPDRKRLATGSRDGTARVWNLVEPVGRARVDLDSPVHALAIGPSGQVAIARDDSVVSLLPAEAGKVQDVLRLLGHATRVYAAAWSPDGTQFATAGEDEETIVRSARDPETILHRLGRHDGPVRSIAYSADGRLIATAADDGQIRVWNAANGTRVTTLGSAGSSATPRRKLVQVAFGKGDTLASLDDLGELTLWDTGRWKIVERHRSLTDSNTRALAFSHDGARIAVSGATDGAVFEVTALGIGRRLAVLDSPTADVRALAFSIDDSWVFTAGGDGMIRIWEAAKGKQIGVHDAQGAALESLVLSPDGDRLWAGGEAPTGGVVRAWDVRGTVGYVELLRALGNDPWQLCDDDVVRLKGDCDDQR
jgi:eukaryotic-like serine/threonine-protein kinase